MPSSPFVSLASLEQDFAGGLAAMLDKHRGLGVYILVLANAAYDPALWARLSLALAKRHAELAAELTATLRRADKLAEPDDDVMVFLKLNLIGFDHLGRLESRRAGPWEVMFNPVRALRPPRISGQQFEGLQCPFDAMGFHFNKPFLAKELLWKAISPASGSLLYNKFPLPPARLVVPEPLRRRRNISHRNCTAGLGHLWQSSVPASVSATTAPRGLGQPLHFQSFVQTTP